MQDLFFRLTRYLEAIGDGASRVAAWLVPFMVVLAIALWVVRQATGAPQIALRESLTYLSAALFVLGAAYALQREGGFRVVVAADEFPLRWRQWVALLGALLFTIPVSLLVLWSSWEYVSNSWGLAEVSREKGGLPWVYVLKSLIPLLGGLLFLQGMGAILSNSFSSTRLGQPTVEDPLNPRDEDADV